jgi:hypothetical protein
MGMAMTATRQRLVTPGVVRVVVIAAALTIGWWIPRPDQILEIRFLYSNDAYPVVDKIQEFNALGWETDDGRPIVVDAEAMPSGVVVQSMCESEASAGCERPAVWLPAATTWLRLLRPDKDWAEESPTSLLVSPQVLVMWKDIAQKLERSGQPVTLAQVLHSDGLVFAHARPDSSTSGFHAALAEIAAAERARAEEGLDGALEGVKAFESSVGAVCTKSSDLLGRPNPRKAFDVAYLQETTFAAYNKDRGNTEKLVAEYPIDAMYIADYPLTVMSRAPWVKDDPDLLDAATRFTGWLEEHVTQEDADEDYFRKPTATNAIGDAGVNLIEAGAKDDLGEPLPVPSFGVLRATQQLWPTAQRPLDVALVIDSSESLAPSLEDAQTALHSLEDHLDDVDRVWTIQQWPQTETEDMIADMIAAGDWRTPLRHTIDSLQASDKISQLWAEMRAGFGWLNSVGRTDHLQVLVVLTVGNAADPPERYRSTVPVFVVQMGDGDLNTTLERLASESGGRVIDVDHVDSVEEMANVAEAC